MADSKSGRKKIALLLAGMVLGAALITPAGAHISSVSHTWKKHFLPLAKKAFYTKTESNARYLGKTAKATDADNLDGQDSSAFLGATAKATDSELLDGKDSTQFAGTSHTHSAADITNEAAAKAGARTTGTLTATGTDVASTSVTFPSGGFAIVTVQAAFKANENGTWINAVLVRDGSALTSWYWDPGDVDSYYDQFQSTSQIVPVTAGAHTFALRLGEGSASTFSNYIFAQVNVQFVPTAL